MRYLCTCRQTNSVVIHSQEMVTEAFNAYLGLDIEHLEMAFDQIDDVCC